jgi:D-amino-acid dehydrogenase
MKLVVIGAGILGASTAYHLAKAGESVLLVDRGDVGQATDAAAGIVCPWLSQRRNKSWYQLVKGGARYYPTLVEMLKEDGEMETGYRKVGAISLHKDPSKLEQMAERALKRREDAPEIGEIKILTPKETKQLVPPLAPEYGSVYVSGGARVNGRAMRDALVNGAMKNGASLVRGASASFAANDLSVPGVMVNGERIEADIIVVAGGAWASEMLKPLGLNFSVKPQKAQIIHLGMDEMETADWPVVMPPNDQYLLGFEAGRVVIGATHEDETGFDSRVTAGGIHEVLTKALEIAPGLTGASILETRVGFRPFTPGFLPIFGAVPGFTGLYVANGLGASGLTSGPYLGSELTKLILGTKTELPPENYQITNALVL